MLRDGCYQTWQSLYLALRGRIDRAVADRHVDSLYAAYLETQLRTLDDEYRTLVEALEDVEDLTP
jgi:hypothetical protein